LLDLSPSDQKIDVSCLTMTDEHGYAVAALVCIIFFVHMPSGIATVCFSSHLQQSNDDCDSGSAHLY